MPGRFLRAVQHTLRGIRDGEPLEEDETVVLFPQSASLITPGRWRVPLHAWVVELEQGTVSRRLGQHSVLNVLDLLDVVEDQPMSDEFRSRLNWFMADREMNKRLQISIGDQTYRSPRSPPNGHIKFNVEYLTDAAAGSLLNYGVAGHPPGQIQLVGKTGLSVISDIDDTIKISNVTDKKQLVKGFFFDDYHVVAGMPEVYATLQQQFNACFHYVSASPWQLYPTLSPMMQAHYPFGSLSQRHFYIADRSFVQFFRSSREYKVNAITDIIERFSGRRFLLIGDSGERDPEVYAEVACRYPKQVAAIFIRRVEGDFRDTRFRIPDSAVMHYFSDPLEILPVAAKLAAEVQP